MEKEVIIIKIRGYEADEVMALVGDLRQQNGDLRQQKKKQKETVIPDDVPEQVSDDGFLDMVDGKRGSEGLALDIRKTGEREWERFKNICVAAEMIGIGGSTLSHKLKVGKGRIRYKGYEIIYAHLNNND